MLLVLGSFVRPECSQASSRTAHRFGLDVGVLTSPFPSLFGVSASYNLLNSLRLSAGYGSVSGTASTVDANTLTVTQTNWSFTTLAGDIKIFPVDWNFAPFGVVGYTHVSFTGSGSGLGNVSAGGSAIYYGFGFDWTSNSGFNMGFEYKMTKIASESVGLPGFYIGWFF